ncbi:MAG TPA: hypothetical protein ENI74_08795 [Gammaproteobacteria bacterium]|nr:hypothetical protein [Gammaproteobacteria bacterium]
MGRQGLILAVLLALGACSAQDEEDGAKESASESQHPWKDQENALHKAEQVEQNMMDAFKRRDEEMEKQAQ